MQKVIASYRMVSYTNKMENNYHSNTTIYIYNTQRPLCLNFAQNDSFTSFGLLIANFKPVDECET